MEQLIEASELGRLLCQEATAAQSKGCSEPCKHTEATGCQEHPKHPMAWPGHSFIHMVSNMYH